jgi:hypothetical protein
LYHNKLCSLHSVIRSRRPCAVARAAAINVCGRCRCSCRCAFCMTSCHVLFMRSPPGVKYRASTTLVGRATTTIGSDDRLDSLHRNVYSPNYGSDSRYPRFLEVVSEGLGDRFHAYRMPPTERLHMYTRVCEICMDSRRELPRNPPIGPAFRTPPSPHPHPHLTRCVSVHNRRDPGPGPQPS